MPQSSSERIRARDGVPQDRVALEASYSRHLEQVEAELRTTVEEGNRLGLDTHALRHAMDTIQDPRHAGMGQEKVEKRRAAIDALKKLVRRALPADPSRPDHLSADQQVALTLIRTIEES